MPRAVAVDAVLEHLERPSPVQEVWFVLYSAPDLAVYRRELERRLGAPQQPPPG